MKQKMLDELIAEYLSPDISADKKGELKGKLISSGYNKIELEELENLYSNIDGIEVPRTSEKLDLNFYRSLEMYKDGHNGNNSQFKVFLKNLKNLFRNKYALRFAYSLTLLAVGWYIGGWTNQDSGKLQSMSKEIDQMKQVMMYSMLEQPSATKRIKAISYADEFETVDDKILNAFLDTLNNDPNPNVRLTAVEALSKYSDVQFVRSGLIKSISVQESPLVQVALLDLMLKLKDKSSIIELNRLLENRELNYSVRNKTKETIQQL